MDTLLSGVIPRPVEILVKLDVEGAEPEVLSGATKVLRRESATSIVFESLTPQDIKQSSELLEANGYNVIRLASTYYYASTGPRPTAHGEST